MKPITPTEAAKPLEPKPLRPEVVQFLNERLREEYDGRTSVTVNMAASLVYPEAVVDAYSLAGWDVQYVFNAPNNTYYFQRRA